MGTIDSSPSLFWLDDHHAFEVGRPERVCANTASMLSDTRLDTRYLIFIHNQQIKFLFHRYGKHFKIVGKKETHFGGYPCNPTIAAAQYGKKKSAGGCGPSGC